ncbi:MAG: UbiX family flavin prenyltransferase [Desulfuromonadaceae bacterium]|nr:UbiX family flavin prenyltransferase [Desulfuromonadaceae bacterium]MDD5105490.1 UbiX family flavin prenyltransferase [Desulfuromonadaceae bacterium]
MTQRHVFIALTGASGSMYGLRLAEQLCLNGFQVTFCASCSGTAVCREETGLDLSGDLDKALQRLYEHLEIRSGLQLVHPDDLFCAAASGSSAPDAVVVCPCSMGSLARIAGGISGNLIERAADVMLKEHRPLLLVPRETPLSDIHLENMLKLSRSGARIIPAMPAFYGRSDSVLDLVDFVVGKILDQLGIDNDLYKRWGTE